MLNILYSVLYSLHEGIINGIQMLNHMYHKKYDDWANLQMGD